VQRGVCCCFTQVICSSEKCAARVLALVIPRWVGAPGREGHLQRKRAAGQRPYGKRHAGSSRAGETDRNDHFALAGVLGGKPSRLSGREARGNQVSCEIRVMRSLRVGPTGAPWAEGANLKNVRAASRNGRRLWLGKSRSTGPDSPDGGAKPASIRRRGAEGAPIPKGSATGRNLYLRLQDCATD